MGLAVDSLAEISPDLERRYWVYLLNYGLQSGMVDAIRQNFVEIAQRTSKSKAVLILGSSRHFDSEVLSWRRVFGLSGDEHLPALLITTKNPHEFASFDWPRDEDQHEFVLVPLRALGSTGDDAVAALNSILRDIEERTPLADFAIRDRLAEKGRQANAKILVLQPNFAGIGVDLLELYDATRRYFRRKHYVLQ